MLLGIASFIQPNRNILISFIIQTIIITCGKNGGDVSESRKSGWDLGILFSDG